MELIIGKLSHMFSCIFDGSLIIVVARFGFGVQFRIPAGACRIQCHLSVYLFISGLFISATSATQQVAMMKAVLSTMLPSIMLSGFLFPLSSIPKVLQYISISFRDALPDHYTRNYHERNWSGPAQEHALILAVIDSYSRIGQFEIQEGHRVIRSLIKKEFLQIFSKKKWFLLFLLYRYSASYSGNAITFDIKILNFQYLIMIIRIIKGPVWKIQRITIFFGCGRRQFFARMLLDKGLSDIVIVIPSDFSKNLNLRIPADIQCLWCRKR